ncbi:MAG: hypothetical protein Q4C47_08405 [Planctomycetia bacterium]|nr:hypothetical protein [Planctomycetia bacterium]
MRHCFRNGRIVTGLILAGAIGIFLSPGGDMVRTVTAKTTTTTSVVDPRLDAEMMRAVLRTQTVEEDRFLGFILNLSEWDARYEPLIEGSFLWAQQKPEHRYQYFRNALKKRAPELQEEWETGLQLDEEAIMEGLATRVFAGLSSSLTEVQKEYVSYVVARAKDGTIPPTLVVRVYDDVTGRSSLWKKFFSIQPRFVVFQRNLEEYILARRIRWNPPS